MNAEIYPSRTSGTLILPASKSACHRAIICASLADGQSVLSNISLSSDIEATIGCMKALGASIESGNESGQLIIHGCQPQNRNQPVVLDARESGSTLRFLIPVASLSSQPAVFHGSPVLLSRPMGIYADLFLSQNLVFDQSGSEIKVCGPLQGGLFQIPGDVSSQFISGLLFASPLMEQGSVIAVLPPFESQSYTDMTVQMMNTFGIDIKRPTPSGFETACQSYKPCDLRVESDYSQMAFFAVLAALSDALSFEGMNPGSLQGDKVILDFIEQAGARVVWNGDTVTVEPAKNPVSIKADLANCPDLGPILCVLAAYLPGKSVLNHTRRLRIKESDRAMAMEQELKKWGVNIQVFEDSIEIEGKREWKADHTVIIDSHNDHRIVMAMTIFGLLAKSPSIIEGAQAVNKSYPDFFKDVEKIGGRAVLS